MLKPLRYKVGGPSEVYASSRAAFFLCGINRRDMGVLLMRLQGQGGWRIAYFADNLQIFCDFLGDFMKKIYFCGKV